MLERRHFITNVSECSRFAHERPTFIFQDVSVLRSYLFGVTVLKLVSLCEIPRKVILKSHGSFINICRDCWVRFPLGRAVLISHLNSVSLWLHVMCKLQMSSTSVRPRVWKHQEAAGRLQKPLVLLDASEPPNTDTLSHVLSVAENVPAGAAEASNRLKPANTSCWSSSFSSSNREQRLTEIQIVLDLFNQWT